MQFKVEKKVFDSSLDAQDYAKSVGKSVTVIGATPKKPRFLSAKPNESVTLLDDFQKADVLRLIKGQLSETVLPDVPQCLSGMSETQILKLFEDMEELFNVNYAKFLRVRKAFNCGELDGYREKLQAVRINFNSPRLNASYKISPLVLSEFCRQTKIDL